MSFGKSSSNNQSATQSQASSQTALDPQVKAALLQNVAHAQSLDTPYQPYTGEMVAPLNGVQQQAQQGVLGIAANDVGGQALQNAVNTTQNVAGYSPTMIAPTAYAATAGTAAQTPAYTPATISMVGAANANAASAGPAAQTTASQINPNAVQTISAPTIGADQINAFLNPYTDDVVSTTNADLTRQQQIQQQLNAAQATQAGAFGGSGSAIMDSQTVDSYARQMAEQDAALQSAGYSTALTAAQQQAAQELAASQSNQSTALSAGTTNANLGEQTGLANTTATNQQNQFNAGNVQQANLTNAGAQNTALLADQAAANQGSEFNATNLLNANQFNTGAANTFGLANLNATNAALAANANAANVAAAQDQAAGLTGAGLNLQAGAQEGTLSAQQLAQALGIQQAVANVGTQDQNQQQAVDTAAQTQYQNAQNWPLLLQQLLNQSLGLAGDPTLGTSQSSSTGTSSGSSTGTSLNTGLSFAPIPT